jgi:hypothetical protein
MRVDLNQQELLLDIKRAESLGDPSSWSAARSARDSSRPGSSCSALSAATAGAHVDILFNDTFTFCAELDALLASRARNSASIHHNDHQSELNLRTSTEPDHPQSGVSVADALRELKPASPDKENEPAITAAAPTSSSSSSESTACAANARLSTVDEPDSVTVAAVFSTVGTAVRRPSSSLKPPISQPARVPPTSSVSQVSSSIASSGNARSNHRAEGLHTFVKPPSPLTPAASCGPAVRGKGWVAGVSDSMGLALSGGDIASFCVYYYYYSQNIGSF